MINAWAIEITKSIYEGKWLSIRYLNANKEETYFWCAITDIIPTKRMLIVDVYNQEKTPGYLKDFKIYIEGIKQANVVEGSSFEKQEKLIEKIKNNLEDFLFLELKSLDDRVLNYYLDCYAQDQEPFHNEFTLFKGLDIHRFSGDIVKLSDSVFKELINVLNSQLRMKINTSTTLFERVVINYLSIHRSDTQIIPLVYYNVKIDIENKLLIRDEKLTINSNHVVDGNQQAYISNYIDVDYKFFKENFIEHEQEFIEQIQANLDGHEKLDQLPYLLKISTRNNVSLRTELTQIMKRYKDNKLNKPLSSFFGLIEKDTKRTKVRPLLIEQKRINVNQLRAVYNAINRNIVFIQGPPGTGKTVSIINIIHSCLLNGESALIASNNNEAINNIVKKLNELSFNDVSIHYPFLRLGSDEHIRISLRKLNETLNYFSLFSFKEEFELRLLDIEDLIQANMHFAIEVIEKYENKLEIEQRIEGLKNFIRLIEEDQELDDFTKVGNRIDFEAQIHKQSELYEKSISKTTIENLDIDTTYALEALYLLSLEYGKKLLNDKYKNLRSIIMQNDEEQRIKDFKTYIQSDEGMKRLLEVCPIIFSTNISTTKLGVSNSYFDLLVMEEASQCSNALSLLPMSRCKRACFIGDQNQLQPVVTLTDEINNRLKATYNVPDAYDYKANSILTTLLKIDTVSKFIMLDKHYRCPARVINFANKKYYQNQLDINNLASDDSSLKLVDIKKTGTLEPNTSMAEVSAILEELKLIPKNEEAAIITPFKKQAKLIERILLERGIDNVKVGTIHTFQGQEKDHVIVSSAITNRTKQGTFDWVKNNKELINVMTTRPKKKLTVIADVEAIKRLSCNEMNDYFELVDYISVKGNKEILTIEEDEFSSRVNGYRDFTTQSERELLKTIQHYRSTNQKFGILVKPKVSDLLVFSNEESELFNYGNAAHFDLVLMDNQHRPLMAIEVCGPEHYDDPIVIARDKKKAEICSKRNLHLITVLNENVRKYNEIRQIIIDTLRN